MKAKNEKFLFSEVMMAHTANLENNRQHQNAALPIATMALTMAAVNGLVPGSILPNSQFQFLKSLDSAAKVAHTSLSEFLSVFGQGFLSFPAGNEIIEAARNSLFNSISSLK